MTTVIMQVIERGTSKEILPAVEVSMARKDGETDVYLLDRAKRNYLSELDKLEKFNPSVKKSLTGVSWTIDGCII